MESSKFSYAANPIVAALQKRPSDFNKEDIINYVVSHGIRGINFMYPGGDGRLKTLNFVINDLDYLDSILSSGERVDGSSLFPFITSGNSDLYVLPRFATAFIDPFAEESTLCMLGSFFDKDCQPLESAPEHTLLKAMRALKDTTGLDFHAMGELEYYVIRKDDGCYPASDQHGYHESGPYSKDVAFRTKCMRALSSCGCQIKYGHSEVGNFVDNGLNYEQNEIEFLPVPADEAAGQILIAKWVIRNMAYREGLEVTFAPKITIGKAGSGMHIHMRLMRDGKSAMVKDGDLSSEALTAIAGMMDLAGSITAFGNKNPMSYYRLVPRQEAPTNICWGKSNRSALVRVPLGWAQDSDMCAIANPSEMESHHDYSIKQTVEMRSPDGSADIYQLLAGLCVACRHGFEMPDAGEVVKRTFVEGNIHDQAHGKQIRELGQLPDSCAASADRLEQQRAVYEAGGVFSPAMIDGIISTLRSYHDRTLRHDMQGNSKELTRLVRKYFHCG